MVATISYLYYYYREQSLLSIVKAWKTKEKHKATYDRLLRVCWENGQVSCADAIVKLVQQMKKQLRKGKYCTCT